MVSQMTSCVGFAKVNLLKPLLSVDSREKSRFVGKICRVSLNLLCPQKQPVHPASFHFLKSPDKFYT